MGAGNPVVRDDAVLLHHSDDAMTTETFVYTMNKMGSKGAWSRYIFPWNVEAQAQLNNDLYLRSGDTIYIMDKERIDDQDENGDDVPVDMTIRWPYLDFGAPGVTKQMLGFDLAQAIVKVALLRLDLERKFVRPVGFGVGANQECNQQHDLQADRGERRRVEVP